MNLPKHIDSLLNGAHGEKFRFLLAGGVNTIAAYLLFALGLWLLTPVFAPLTLIDSSYWQYGSTTPFPFDELPFLIGAVPALKWIGENSYLVIQWIMWVIGVPLAAANLKYFAFRAEGPYLPQALRAYLVYLPMQVVTFLFLAFFTLVLGMHPLLGQLFALGIATIMSYFGHKYFTFKQA